MSKLISYKTALLAQKRGFSVIYSPYKYNPEGELVVHDNGINIAAPTMDDLQVWLEEKGTYIAVLPEFYTTGINWNWQLLWREPESTWVWIDTGEIDDDGKAIMHPENIVGGTGMYGDNGEYPTRHDAIESAIHMGLMKLDIYYRNNSVDLLAKLYGVSMNEMLDKIRALNDQLGDWSFREFTEEQLDIIVKNIGESNVGLEAK